MSIRHFSLLILLLICIAFSVPALGEGDVEPVVPRYAAEQFELIDGNSSPEALALLQQRLIQLGYLEGEADGAFNTATVDALIACQAANGLEPDGVAAPELLAALYNDGVIAADGTAFPAFDLPEDEQPAVQFIGNKNTKKFHSPGCDSVNDMKDSNKVEFATREEAVDAGYVPCKRCNP